MCIYRAAPPAMHFRPLLQNENFLMKVVGSSPHLWLSTQSFSVCGNFQCDLSRGQKSIRNNYSATLNVYAAERRGNFEIDWYWQRLGGLALVLAKVTYYHQCIGTDRNMRNFSSTINGNNLKTIFETNKKVTQNPSFEADIILHGCKSEMTLVGKSNKEEHKIPNMQTVLGRPWKNRSLKLNKLAWKKVTSNLFAVMIPYCLRQKAKNSLRPYLNSQVRVNTTNYSAWICKSVALKLRTILTGCVRCLVESLRSFYEQNAWNILISHLSVTVQH